MSAKHKIQESPVYEFEGKSFIEVQFPIAKLSKESYKERKAVAGQTLTGLGKWWGRKPLILVRATIIGCLMPASNDPNKDRETFLKILTMDEEGLWLRKNKNLPTAVVYKTLDAEERTKYFPANVDELKPKYLSDLTYIMKKKAERIVWSRLNYDEKLKYCLRPEEIEGPSEEVWSEINAHLATSANSVHELVQELGKKKFGHIPNVGDAFSGGGSVPFEAARIGCNTYGADLNPVSTLLTWGGLKILGANTDTLRSLTNIQDLWFKKLKKVIFDWGIEQNEQGWCADAYLYCNESTCPECNWDVPLSPTWVISDRNKVIAKLISKKATKSFDIEIVMGASKIEILRAKNGTIGKSGLCCPNCQTKTPIRTLRGDRVITDQDKSGKDKKAIKLGLRIWENHDIIPSDNDTFRERLYCIRWQQEKGEHFYAAPSKQDLKREEKVLSLLKERFSEWQKKGFIPSLKIESGDKTDELMRTRGWTHWHHLFNPRQLLVHGQLNEIIAKQDKNDQYEKVLGLLLIARFANWNSRLSQWLQSQSGGNGGGKQTFANQALNPLYNYSCRPTKSLTSSLVPLKHRFVAGSCDIETIDARAIIRKQDLWITDPPYADAVSYHELSEYFISWFPQKNLPAIDGWDKDSRRALAVRGSGEEFSLSMIQCYKNLNNNMDEKGLQIVMFTHQDTEVWASLASILWAAGLQVITAWCVATETTSALKDGNYVKGTVFLTLKKRTCKETAFVDELYPQIEDEVKKQVDTLLYIDDESDPNFGDADFQLAAYAAALRVLTSYETIEDIDIDEQIRLKNKKNSPIAKIIEDAVRIATEYQVPHGLNVSAWKKLEASERLYLKGLEIESRGEYRDSVYQELARGFGVSQYKDLLASSKANEVRLKSPSEFARKDLGSSGFGSSLIRSVLFSIYEARRQDGIIHGKNWLRQELPDYWNQKKQVMQVLEYLSSMANKLPQWKEDGDVARLLKGAIQNDHV